VFLKDISKKRLVSVVSQMNAKQSLRIVCKCKPTDSKLSIQPYSQRQDFKTYYPRSLFMLGHNTSC